MVPKIVLEAKSEAERILEEAARAARAMAEQASEAYARARQEGLEQGLAEASARAAELVASAKLEAGRLIAEAEEQTVKLALEIAGLLVGEELEAAPTKAGAMVRRVLRQAAGAHKLVVRVNPADAALVEEMLGEGLGDKELPNAVELIADSRIARGGCLVQGDDLAIDARLETRLEALSDMLLKKGNGRRTSGG